VRTIAGLFSAWFLFGSFVCSPAQEPAQPNDNKSQGGPVMEASNVLYRYSPDLAVLIVRLRGTLVPTEGHSVVTFNDSTSFAMAIEAAEMRLSADQLASLMNERIAASPKAQVKNVRISVSGQQLRIDGTMKKGIHVPFHAVAEVGVSSDNRVRMSLRQVSVGPLPMKGLLDAFGLSVDDLVSQKGLAGMSVDGDAFLIDPQTVFPPPHTQARLTSVKVANDGLVLQFGGGAPRLTSGERGNYIALRGGRIEYGREEMFDSNLTMTDSTPGDPFEFYLGHYWRQIVASQIKMTANGSLRIRVPDYAKIKGQR
jgi:hypothetical protein